MIFKYRSGTMFALPPRGPASPGLLVPTERPIQLVVVMAADQVVVATLTVLLMAQWLITAAVG